VLRRQTTVEIAPMPEDNRDRRLDNLSTSWTLLQQAHDQELPPERQTQARQQLLERYLEVVRKYLAGALKNEPNHAHLVDDLVGKFGELVMDRKLQAARPERGRFRDFVRTILVNLINSYYREKRRAPGSLGESDPGAAEDLRRRLRRPQKPGEKEVLSDSEELLLRAREALAEEAPTAQAPPPALPAQLGEQVIDEKELRKVWVQVLHLWALRVLSTEQPVAAGVLKLHLDNESLTSDELARKLPTRPNSSDPAGWVRKQLARARKRLKQLIRQGVQHSLDQPTEEALQEELAELGLLELLRDSPT
jgi:RNA polymerase sigma-70 factor (ECF subfamily)